MKHILTLTFAIDDEGTDSVLGYALDQVLEAIKALPLDKDHGEGFVRADMDGELMVDKDGNTSEDVKCLKRYKPFLKSLAEG